MESYESKNEIYNIVSFAFDIFTVTEKLTNSVDIIRYHEESFGSVVIKH